MRKVDYQLRAALVLDKGKPYSTSVKQHGPFESFRKTYGVEGEFPMKAKYEKKPPNYGPFRIGNPMKAGIT